MLMPLDGIAALLLVIFSAMVDAGEPAEGGEPTVPPDGCCTGDATGTEPVQPAGTTANATAIKQNAKRWAFIT